MNKSVKIFLIVMCCIAAIGLIAIGAGIVLGGDFGEIWNNIVLDLYVRMNGGMVG